MTNEPRAAAHAAGPDAAGPDAAGDGVRRRGFLSGAGAAAMAGGLAASYGTLGAMAARFLYPEGGAEGSWVFLAAAAGIRAGDSFTFHTPAGASIAVARVAETGAAEDFLALSSTCPHLGCQVHWEAQNKRFFCPCHNGTFDPTGKPTGGPPAAAGQFLPRYELKLEKGLLYIALPSSTLARGEARAGFRAPPEVAARRGACGAGGSAT